MPSASARAVALKPAYFAAKSSLGEATATAAPSSMPSGSISGGGASACTSTTSRSEVLALDFSTAEVGELSTTGASLGSTAVAGAASLVDSSGRAGAASRNPDGVAHAIVETISTSPYVTKVGFEDLWGGGDRDFDDLVFSFSNLRTAGGSPFPSNDTGGSDTTGTAVTSGAVDEPQTLLLFGSGLAVLGLLRRRAQNAE